MARGFRALSQIAKAAINAYVEREAESDPEAWRRTLRELIAADEERLAGIVRLYPKAHGGSLDGFTLIELSIVLVIIGLILGGVLVGQDLIRAAGVRAQITQIEKFNTAANTFRDKYGGLPGDLSAASAAQFGLISRTGAISLED